MLHVIWERNGSSWLCVATEGYFSLRWLPVGSWCPEDDTLMHLWANPTDSGNFKQEEMLAIMTSHFVA